MSEIDFIKIRSIDSLGAESWCFSNIAEVMSEVADLQEWFISSQLQMIDDGIDLSLHTWSIGDDYILDRTACGYLLASCPDYYDSVKAGQKYFNCSQVRRARAIVDQIEVNTKRLRTI